jgi:hypothetical protein
LILIATVPKKEIHRLAIYGIIFGGLMDVLMLIFGKITGQFGWINYGPLGFMGIPIFADVSWAIFFIMYFYFLPKIKPFNYIFAGAGVFFSVLYTNLVIDLGIFTSNNRTWSPLISFVVWFSIATWGYYKMNSYIEGRQVKEPTDQC